MNELYKGGENSPFKYTIRIDTVTDMKGYVVEILDGVNLKNYTLNDVYLERSLAIKDADEFVNNLLEKEILGYIN